jgi:hypothetical protein
MWIGSAWRGICRFFGTWNRLNKDHQYISAFVGLLVLPCVLLGGVFIYLELSEAYDKFKFNHLSAAEHLHLAQDACRTNQYNGTCVDPPTANLHLNKIPHDAAEYGDAYKLMEAIQLQQQAAEERQRQHLAGQEAQRLKLANQTREESFEQMQRNVAGTAHDPYRCAATSTVGTQFLTFDNGHYWWNDDGRCAAEELMRQAAAEQRQNEQRAAHQRHQKQRDEDAQPSSYWPTTLRVDTDMDSFWLNNEERTCQTSPDDKGRVARVTCSGNASHHDHSIPVKFWGGVDRNTVSDWKCRREGDPCEVVHCALVKLCATDWPFCDDPMPFDMSYAR